MASPGPLVGLRRIDAVEGFGHGAERLLYMKTVHDLDGAPDGPTPGALETVPAGVETSGTRILSEF